MRVPQRLQIVARCLVVLTGNFLNMVAKSSFIDRSSSRLDVRHREQWQCQPGYFSSLMRNRWILEALLRKGRLFWPSWRRDSVQKWPEIGKLVQKISVLLLKIAKLAINRLFLSQAAGAWVAGFSISLSVFSDKIGFVTLLPTQRAGMEITWIGLSIIWLIISWTRHSLGFWTIRSYQWSR